MNVIFKKIKLISTIILVSTILLLPTVIFAAGIVPCDGTAASPCTYYKLIELGKNLINFFTLISIPLAAIAFAYAGFLFITGAGNESKIKEAKSIGTKVLIGFLFILSAWLIVYLITSNLLSSEITGGDFPIK